MTEHRLFSHRGSFNLFFTNTQGLWVHITGLKSERVVKKHPHLLVSQRTHTHLDTLYERWEDLWFCFCHSSKCPENRWHAARWLTKLASPNSWLWWWWWWWQQWTRGTSAWLLWLHSSVQMQLVINLNALSFLKQEHWLRCITEYILTF